MVHVFNGNFPTLMATKVKSSWKRLVSKGIVGAGTFYNMTRWFFPSWTELVLLIVAFERAVCWCWIHPGVTTNQTKGRLVEGEDPASFEQNLLDFSKVETALTKWSEHLFKHLTLELRPATANNPWSLNYCNSSIN